MTALSGYDAEILIFLMCLIVFIALFPPLGLLFGRSGRPCWANLASLGGNVGLSWRILEGLGDDVNLSCELLAAMFTHLVDLFGNVVKGRVFFDSFFVLFPGPLMDFRNPPEEFPGPPAGPRPPGPLQFI